jgi:hypothetical protein
MDPPHPPKRTLELSETMLEINNLEMGIGGKSTTYVKNNG